MAATTAAQSVRAREGGTPVSRKRIVVIGAGLAGLAAARELQTRGHAVTIVEARERSGGRIWTSTRWPDMPVDLGATWVHGVKGNPLTALAECIQARRLSTTYARTARYNTAGQALAPAEEDRLEGLSRQVFRALERAQNGEEDTSIRQAIDPLLRRLSRHAEARRFVDFILSGEIEQEYAGSAEALSAHWYDSAKEFPGGDVLFAQGFAVVTQYLARAVHIELGQEVQEIRWGRSPTRVITQQSEYPADHVLVTLPLGVLQAAAVRFAPELPHTKRNAVAKLGMGVLNKCYLRFSRAFWPADVDWLEYIPERHCEWTEWVSFTRAAAMPILLGFNAAARGREIESWSDREVVASAMQVLGTMFGPNIPEPLDYQITRWASDPYALGSYSYNPVGATPNLRKEIARPWRDLVFFAGEACSEDYFGTAHGAYLSGLRAAAEILVA